MRIVSLLASATEIVCALGAGEMLVGRSHECDNPEWVRQLPKCSEPAFDVTVPSREIDDEVRRRLHAGEPLYTIHTELIQALQPDLLLTQSHCEVCAITPADVARSGACIVGAKQVAVSASKLDDIFGSIRLIAAALGLEERGEQLVAQEQARLENVRQVCAGFTAPSLVMIEWTDPIFAMGNWGPELVELANGRLLIGHKGEYSTAMKAERLREVDPECLIIAPCGYELERSLRELPVLEQHPWWGELQPVRNGRVAFADGNLFFNRSGMTVSRTAEIIAEILHGVRFEDSREGQWVWAGAAVSTDGTGETVARETVGRV